MSRALEPHQRTALAVLLLTEAAVLAAAGLGIAAHLRASPPPATAAAAAGAPGMPAAPVAAPAAGGEAPRSRAAVAGARPGKTKPTRRGDPMTQFLWGVYPYLCIVLFFGVPVLRMAFRPFSWSTRASSLFGHRLLGAASLLMHWGLFLIFLGHFIALFGGLVGSEAAVGFFYWAGLAGGLMALAGSAVALLRRLQVPEVRAMSQPEDYVVHLFILAIVGLALFQVLAQGLFGLAFTASSWFASLWALSPQPELMASASLITKLHVFLALTFFAYFPFTKLVHLWTYPLNYAVRPYQSVRTARYLLQRRWELALRSDKSFLVYALGSFVLAFFGAALLLGRASSPAYAAEARPAAAAAARSSVLMGYPLYVSQCARCHGVDGKGDGAGAGSSTFGQPPRDLTAAAYRFVSTRNGLASDADLHWVIERGLVSSGMPAFDELSTEQVASLVEVLRGFEQPGPAPGEAIPVPPRPARSAATVALGKERYAACAGCHGASGRGDGPAGAALQDWRGRHVPPADLRAGALKATRTPEQLYLRVAAGIPNGGGGYLMTPFGASFSDEEIWAIVDYVEAEVLPPGALQPRR